MVGLSHVLFFSVLFQGLIFPSSAKKCTATIDNGQEELETLCYTVIEEHDGAALQIRVYDVTSATAAIFPIGAGVTLYQEAQNFAGYYVLGCASLRRRLYS